MRLHSVRRIQWVGDGTSRCQRGTGYYPAVASVSVFHCLLLVSHFCLGVQMQQDIVMASVILEPRTQTHHKQSAYVASMIIKTQMWILKKTRRKNKMTQKKTQIKEKIALKVES